MEHEVLDAARAALPEWVTWFGAIAWPLLAGVCSWGLASATLWLATPRCRPLAPVAPIASTKTPFRDPYADTAVHWMERARLAYGPRVVAVANVLLLPLLFGMLSIVQFGPLAPGSSVTRALLVGGPAFVGAFLVRTRYENRLRLVDWSRSYWLKSHATSALLLAPHALIAAVVGVAMPATLTARSLAAAALALALIVALSLGGNVLALRALGLLQRAPERLQRAVDRAAERTGRSPRETLVGTIAAVNVYSFPTIGRVVTTQATLDALDDESLSAMFGHALAHLTESSRRSLLRGLFAPMMFVPLMLARPLFQYGIMVFYAALIASFGLVVILSRTLRYDFKEADRLAREAEETSGNYARALAKVYEANVVPAVLNQKTPARAHLYDRLLAAGMTPDCPRPAPPRLGRAMLTLFAMIVSLTFFAAMFVPTLGSLRPESEEGRHGLVAFTGGRAGVLGDLAYSAWRRHDIDGAVALYRLAASEDPRDVFLPANLAIVLGNAGRCAESAAAVRSASARLERQDEPDEAARAIVEAAHESLERCAQTGASATSSN